MRKFSFRLLMLTMLLVFSLVLGPAIWCANAGEPAPPGCDPSSLVNVGKLQEGYLLATCANGTLTVALYGTCKKTDVLISVAYLLDPGCLNYAMWKGELDGGSLSPLAGQNFLYHTTVVADCFKKSCSDILEIKSVELADSSPGDGVQIPAYSLYKVALQQVCCP